MILALSVSVDGLVCAYLSVPELGKVLAPVISVLVRWAGTTRSAIECKVFSRTYHSTICQDVSLAYVLFSVDVFAGPQTR